MRQIQVLENYGGRATNEQRVLPGMYAEDDERLFGAVEAMLEVEVARVVGFTQEPDEPLPDNLEDMTVKQLKAQADKQNIVYPSNVSKSALLDLLTKPEEEED